jgi:hypothetical protein
MNPAISTIGAAAPSGALGTRPLSACFNEGFILYNVVFYMDLLDFSRPCHMFDMQNYWPYPSHTNLAYPPFTHTYYM